MKKNKKRIKLSWRNLALLIFVIAFSLFAIHIIWNILTNDPYEKYEICDESTKLYGSMKHETDFVKDEYFYSINYPVLEEEQLNNIVEAYRENHHSPLPDQEGMQMISIDYDCENIFDSYITLTFHEIIQNENDEVIYEEDVSYNYDIKENKMMDVSDVLRRDYPDMLKTYAKENKIDTKQIQKTNLNNFIIKNTEVDFYFENNMDNMIRIPYEENKAYIHLANKNIPSYYMKDRILPETRPAVINDKDKIIAFTFDDGPHASYTQEIMNEFEKYDGSATFFMVGTNIERYPDLVKEVYERGFLIANHSWDHDMGISLTGTMNQQEVRDEVYKPNDEIYKLTGYEPKYFRPPWGAINDTLESVMYMNMVKWDIDSEDWSSHDANTMTNIIMKQVDIGYRVILMHDIHEDSVEGIKQVLAKLHSEGYQFVTIDTLMQYQHDYLTSFNPTREANIVIEPLDY